MRRAIGVFLVGVVIAIVAACGGGGGSFAGIDRLGVTNGTVNGFGSVIVNGVEYQTGTASFTINGSPGSQNQLQVGQVVTINWSTNGSGTYTAQVVNYDSDIIGPIAIGSIDLVARTFVVLGQTVIVDSATSFDPEIVPNSLEGLQAGNIVEISGLVDGSGNIRATRVDKLSAGGDFKVRGVVQNLANDDTFTINQLAVDYSAVVNPPLIANGDLVEVEGSTFNLGGALVATELSKEDQGLPGGDDGDGGELEGYVTAYTSATDFKVSGVPVTTTLQTVVENGTLNDIALNVKLEVEGDIDANGVLVASKISLRSRSGGGDEADAKIQADVDSVNVAAGTLVVAGVTVKVTATTRLEDQRSSPAPVRPFSLANIAVGDYVEVRGIAESDNSVTATFLQREDADSEGELEGPVGAKASPDLTVLGVTVNTDGGTAFFGANDASLNSSQFFSTVVVGDVVEVNFTQNPSPPSTPILADQVQIRAED